MCGDLQPVGGGLAQFSAGAVGRVSVGATAPPLLSVQRHSSHEDERYQSDHLGTYGLKVGQRFVRSFKVAVDYLEQWGDRVAYTWLRGVAPEPHPPAGWLPGSPAASLTITLDRNWRVVRATADVAQQMGRERAALIGADLRDLLDLPAALLSAVENGFATGVPSQVEAPGLLEVNELALYRVQPFADSVVVTMLTMGLRTYLSARGAGDLLGQFEDRPTADILLLNERGIVISHNDIDGGVSGEFQIGGATGAVGEPYLSLWKRLAPGADTAIVRKALADLVAHRSHRFAHTFVLGREHGERFLHVEAMAVRMADTVRLIVLHEDLTGSAYTQAALRAATDQLLTAREDERQRIAIELHDSTSQHLVAAGLGVAKLRRILGANGHTEDVIEDVSRSLEEAMKEIRVLSYLMRPSVVEPGDLEGAARSFIAGFGRRTALSTAFRAEGALTEVGATTTHAAFRVLQEAASNVYRHANARGLEVELTLRSKVLTLRIADDGRGMPSQDGRAPAGVGIASMRTRVSSLGGKFDITCDGAGTVVLAVFPLID
jgi:signal transduction histidine kinase